jgi:hypothetical protein
MMRRLDRALLQCFAPRMKPQTRAPNRATPLILALIVGPLGAFCGFEFTPATLIWVAPGLAVLILVIILVPFIRERMRSAQRT